MKTYKYCVVKGIADLNRLGAEGWKVILAENNLKLDGIKALMEKEEEVVRWSSKVEHDYAIPVEDLTPLLRKEIERCNRFNSSGWGSVATVCIFPEGHDGPHSWVATT